MREQLLAIFQAAVGAVRPDQAIMRHVQIKDHKLWAGGKEFDLDKGVIRVIGAGKGAAPMAQAIEKLLGSRITEGLAVVKYGHTLQLGSINLAEASHPVPDAKGEKAAQEILAIARQCKPNDLLICLFTGGASALLPAPAHGLTLEDIQQTTSLLLASGASIEEVNAIRKHLSDLSGGQLALAANGASVLSIIVSDVIGDSLEAIASGPTAPDSSTFKQCMEIIEKYGLVGQLTPGVSERLEAGLKGRIPETPKPGNPCFDKVTNIIVASNGQALTAAAEKAEEMGFMVEKRAEPMMGEASEIAKELVERAKVISRHLKRGEKPVCLLAGGETTVTLAGEGLGGRNQEMALTAAIELENTENIEALFAGTDGTDGPTDATGGFAFNTSAAKMEGLAQTYLASHDSYHALKKSEDLLVTGPTLTNVMDMAILLVFPPES